VIKNVLLIFQSLLGNIAGTLSAASLVMLAIINLIRAAFEAAEYSPVGPNTTLMRVFGEIESVLVLWIPLVIIAFIALMFTLRVCKLIGHVLVGFVSRCWGKSPLE